MTTTKPAKRCYNTMGARIDNTTRWQSIHPTYQSGKASVQNQSDDGGKASARVEKGGKASARRRLQQPRRSRQSERRQAQMRTFSEENRRPPPAELPTMPPGRERRHRRHRRTIKKVKAFTRKAHRRGGGEGQK